MISVYRPRMTILSISTTDEPDDFDVGDEGTSFPRSTYTRYASRVTYDGTMFRGWQYQSPKIRTVQGVLLSAFATRLNIPVNVIGAGRTDVGVHARGQAIHFDAPAITDMRQFEYSMNKILPDDLKIYNMSRAPNRPNGLVFHATAGAVSKLYVYRFCTNPFIDPLKRRNCAHITYPVDIETVRNSLDIFVGTHDFNAFGNSLDHTRKVFSASPGKPEFTSIRTIYRINLIAQEHCPGYYRIEFYIQSALYQMIRNIVGTCLLAASPRNQGIDIPRLLNGGLSRQENNAKPAPPEGLTLEHVFYDNY